MNKVEFLTKVNTKICRAKMYGRKHSPEILLLLGIAGTVTGTVLACVATTKLPEIKEQKEADMKVVREENSGEDQEHELKRKTTVVYLKSAGRYAAVYTPAIIVSGISLSCLVASNVILRKRLVGVTAAYGALSASFKEYRTRVAERYGEDIEQEIRYGVKRESLTTETVGKNGKIKTTTEEKKVLDPNTLSDTSIIYAEGNRGWTKDPQANKSFLMAQQAALTIRLQSQGYLILNDVYEALGAPKTGLGYVCGWIYNEKEPIGDNFVDFGIFNMEERNIDFVNGYERNIILDFNIDGIITDMI